METPILSDWHAEDHLRPLSTKFVRTVPDENGRNDGEPIITCAAYAQVRAEQPAPARHGRPQPKGQARLVRTGLYEWWVSVPDERRYAEGTCDSLQEAQDSADEIAQLWMGLML